MSQRPDDIKLSTAPDAYHVAQAVVDAAAVKVGEPYLSRAAEIMTLAFGVGVTGDQSRALVAAKLAEWDKPRRLATELFRYLDIEEESDSGSVFRPVSMGCCRAAWSEDLNRIMSELKAETLVGS